MTQLDRGSNIDLLIDRRRAVAAQLAGIDVQLAIAVGDRDAAQRAMHEMNAQVGARYAARFAECREKAEQ